MAILLKTGNGQNPIPITANVVEFGRMGNIFLGEGIKIMGRPDELAAELRRWADVLDNNDVSQQTARNAAQMPVELARPETAWPWLVSRFPWLFDGIDTAHEPYAHYLKKSQSQADADMIKHLQNPTQADVAEVLFGDRTKTGGAYRRRILAALNATTTGPILAYSSHAVKNAA